MDHIFRTGILSPDVSTKKKCTELRGGGRNKRQMLNDVSVRTERYLFLNTGPEESPIPLAIETFPFPDFNVLIGSHSHKPDTSEIYGSQVRDRSWGFCMEHGANRKLILNSTI